MRRSLLVAGVVGSINLAAQAQTFEIIPFTYQPKIGGVQGSRVEGIARDGAVIVGEVCRFGDIGCGAHRPVIWLPSLEMQTLPAHLGGFEDTVLAAADGGGPIIVGYSNGLAAARWIGGPGGTIDRIIESDVGGGVARDVSADGAVVVGDTYVYDENFFAYGHAFVKVGDGPVELLDALDGYVHCRTYGVSADGVTLVGSSYSDPAIGEMSPEAACIWLLETLQPTALPPFTAVPNAGTFATDISSDGRVIIGAAVFHDDAIGGLRYLGVRWVNGPDGWSEPEDFLPDVDCISCYPTRVSGDGGVVIGRGGRTGTFVWREGQPTVDLGQMLVAAGVEIDDWTFPEANGLTDDGRTIVGNVFKRVCECPFCDCVIYNAGFRVVLPPSTCAADFNRDSSLNSQDFFDFLNAFFDGAPGTDFNQDKVVNSQDFFDFLTAFFSGCG